MLRSRICSLFIYLLSVPAMAHSHQDMAAVALPHTQEFALSSVQAGDYLIQVSVPEGEPPEQGYAVLYVLDGNARFPLLRMARETLTRKGPYDGGSPLLIVGIGYPDTERFDMSRRKQDYIPPVPDASAKESELLGGADDFLTFIEQRLKPAIRERFPIDPSREALMGHSYGGLFVLHALLTNPDSFDSYVAISPSIWWNHKYLLNEMPASLESVDNGTPRRVLIGVGELEQAPTPGEIGTPRAKRKQDNAMVDNARYAAESLLRHRPKWEVEFEIFPSEDHGSVMWPASRRAIELLDPRKD